MTSASTTTTYYYSHCIITSGILLLVVMTISFIVLLCGTYKEFDTLVAKSTDDRVKYNVVCGG